MLRKSKVDELKENLKEQFKFNKYLGRWELTLTIEEYNNLFK